MDLIGPIESDLHLLNEWNHAPAYLLRNAELALAVILVIPGACGNTENRISEVQGAKMVLSENRVLFSTKVEFFPAQNIQWKNADIIPMGSLLSFYERCICYQE